MVPGVLSSPNTAAPVDETSAWRVEVKTISTTLEPLAAAEGLRLGLRLFNEGSDLTALFAVTASSSMQAAIVATSRWTDACCQIFGLRTDIDQLCVRRVASHSSAAQIQNLAS